ncbi:membrane-associating domain-containing protein [Lineolata rhizophorae]|uniref:Membrane-associating domain-containing protein n=1 Tax=Lineolata rhizophorae TaxID=578093 RepID=A0A6A6NRD0_9PEZI|nr:membrane-associating domain-containing protein [Lineolata rhizophorae]
MIISRGVSFFLRFAEFAAAAVVLGLIANFLHQHDEGNGGAGPLGREIYTEVVAALAILLSVALLIPTKTSFLIYPVDLLASAAWFAAFGALVDWLDDQSCGGVWYWSNLTNDSWCGEWKAAEAFSFISACLWFASFLLGVFVYHKLAKEPTQTDGTHRRRRWGRSRV